MSKKRIYELAKELNVSNKEVIEVAKKNGFKVGNHMSSLDQAAEAKVKASFVKPVKASSQKQATPKKENSEKKQNVAVNKNSQNARNNNHSKHRKHPHKEIMKGIQGSVWKKTTTIITRIIQNIVAIIPKAIAKTTPKRKTSFQIIALAGIITIISSIKRTRKIKIRSSIKRTINQQFHHVKTSHCQKFWSIRSA